MKSPPPARASLGASALTLAAAAVAAAALPACRAPTYVLVNVDGAGLVAVDSLAVSVTNGGAGSDLTIALPGGAPIAFPTAFVLRLRSPAAGAIDVCVSTVDDVAPVATGCAPGEVIVGDTGTVNVVLVLEPVCGNGVIEGAEACDGADIGTTDCGDVGGGFTAGMLACAADCTFDTNGCYDCGNGVLEAIESCDGAMLGGADCTTIGMGFSGGVLACAPDCSFDAAGCWLCGDGSVNPGEVCDGTDLAGATCPSIAMGFDGGALACDGVCALDTATCCAGTTTCWDGGSAAAAPCRTGPAVGTCVPNDWEYCNCGSGAAPAVFLEPDDDTGPVTSVTVVGPGLSSVTLSMDGGCFGSTGTSCDPDDPCPATTTIVRWSSIGCTIGPFNLCTPGMHDLTLWNNDGGAPCDGSGTVLLTRTYTVP